MILNAFPITEYVFGDNQSHAQIITVVKEDMMKQLLYVLCAVAESTDLFAYPLFPSILFVFFDDRNRLQFSLPRSLLFTHQDARFQRRLPPPRPNRLLQL